MSSVMSVAHIKIFSCALFPDILLFKSIMFLKEFITIYNFQILWLKGYPIFFFLCFKIYAFMKTFLDLKYGSFHNLKTYRMENFICVKDKWNTRAS